MEYPIVRWQPQPDNVYHMDALELCRYIEPGSVDAIITDLPYGTTACTWDTIIPFEPLWAAVKRVLKPGGVFVTTASQPFTSALVMSNPAWFRYEWVWHKSIATQFLDANRKPLKAHENVLVFSAEQSVYNPQFSVGIAYKTNPKAKPTSIYHKHHRVPTLNNGTRYPRTVITFPNERGEHHSQKPVALYEYLIRTYTQPGELVLDFCCGSGTTAVAARNTKRHYIACDTDAGYVETARLRLHGTGIDMLNAREPEPMDALPLFAQAVNA